MGQWRSWIQNFPGYKYDHITFPLWLSGLSINSGLQKSPISNFFFPRMHLIGHMVYSYMLKTPEINGNMQTIMKKKR